MRIPFLNPSITREDIGVVAASLKSGWLVIGPKTREFEGSYARYLGVKHAVATNSCTSALHLVLRAAGILPGDEVITTPLSYVATANAILHAGAVPVFVDVEPDTGLIDVSRVERAITKRTKAILPVHLYGQMADMKKLLALARKRHLLVIEDAAHAIEASRDNITPGTRTAAACYSFHVAKNITAGQGGAVVTNYKTIADQVRLLRRDGVANVGDKRRMLTLGYKMQMTDFQAAMLSSQLKRIDQQHRERRLLWNAYAKACADMPSISFPRLAKNSIHAGHMFVLWVNPEKRDSVRKQLAAAGIETSVHYDPIHLEPYYRGEFGYREGDFPVAERLGASVITLPLWPGMTSRQQGYVIACLRKIA